MNAAQISKDDCVVEVGPGIGTMTQYLAERAGHVVAVEIDKALIPILSDTLSAYDNVEVINEDILKSRFKPSGAGEKRRTSHQGRCQSSLLHHNTHHYGTV